MNSICRDRLLAGRIAPFGHLRINTYLRFPAAFRSLSRPSSAPGAKAFPLRSLQLDHVSFVWVLFKIVVFPDKAIFVSKTCLTLVNFFSRLISASCFIQFSKYRRTPRGCLNAHPKVLQSAQLKLLQAVLPAFRLVRCRSCLHGGLKWTRTTDLTLIRRAL